MAAAGTTVALVVAVKALRATRRAALAEQLLNTLGDMLAALAEISDRAIELGRLPDGEESSRERLSEPFRRFQIASTRVGLLEPALSSNPEYGEWLRAVANNLAADLLQADEFAPMAREEVADPSMGRPPKANEDEWEVLSRSMSYWCVRMVGLDPPKRVPSGFARLEDWWVPRVVAHGHEEDNVYGVGAPYFVQISRLLDDFVREYLEEWATQLVKSGLLR
ncbi:hypothetical protein NLX85_02550 [Micromonospora sp. A3M-1-15]|uniref:hypothetical protein n=1 Tax=Micromonospora sp. A3M-1-15 TaxID=2962035 RepID=UPI0020B777A5|nr:hypothetical protein [Micromonospora sp. A3M-1-15]MCP3782251.1 hypothetical protein [Micromonospora sp. A3M-1-15]